MNVKEAIDELEDRALPEIVALIRYLDKENREKTEKIRKLEAKIAHLEYRGF